LWSLSQNKCFSLTNHESGIKWFGASVPPLKKIRVNGITSSIYNCKYFKILLLMCFSTQFIVERNSQTKNKDVVLRMKYVQISCRVLPLLWVNHWFDNFNTFLLQFSHKFFTQFCWWTCSSAKNQFPTKIQQ
jgi:hypothetical protein